MLLASWLMPLHFLPWLSWHSEALAFLAVLALAVGACSRHRTATSSATWVPRAALMFPALSFLVMAQTAAGALNFWGDALVLLLYFMLCAIAVVSGYSMTKGATAGLDDGPAELGGKPVEWMAWTILAGAIASSLVAMVQAFDVWLDVPWIARMPDQRRPGGNLGQPNHLGTLLLMGLASLIFLSERCRLSRSAVPLAFLVLTVALAASESRTAVLGFALLCAWWFYGRVRAGIKMPPFAVATGAVLFLGLFVAWPVFMSAFGLFPPGAEANLRAGGRLLVWPQLVASVAVQPWGGWGLREVSEAHNAVASNYASAEPFTYAHNLILELALGMGMPLTALLILMAGVWLLRRIACVRSLNAWYCLAAMLPVAVHSMLEFPYAYAYFLVPCMFLLGALEATSGATPAARMPRPVVAIALASTTMLSGWTVIEYLQVEEDFRVARFEALRVGQTPAGYRRPRIVLLTQLDALLDGARIVPKPVMPKEEVDLARKVALRYPWPATQNRYALALALNGSPVEAVRQLRVIRTLHGEQTYQQIKHNWITLAAQQYPELKTIELP